MNNEAMQGGDNIETFALPEDTNPWYRFAYVNPYVRTEDVYIQVGKRRKCDNTKKTSFTWEKQSEKQKSTVCVKNNNNNNQMNGQKDKTRKSDNQETSQKEVKKNKKQMSTVCVQNNSDNSQKIKKKCKQPKNCVSSEKNRFRPNGYFIPHANIQLDFQWKQDVTPCFINMSSSSYRVHESTTFETGYLAMKRKQAGTFKARRKQKLIDKRNKKVTSATSSKMSQYTKDFHTWDFTARSQHRMRVQRLQNIHKEIQVMKKNYKDASLPRCKLPPQYDNMIQKLKHSIIAKEYNDRRMQRKKAYSKNIQY